MIRQRILDCLQTNKDDGQQVDELNEILASDGDKAYVALFQVLTSLDFSASEAKTYWDRIQLHWRMLSDSLERQVSLRTAVCDYFCSVDKSLQNPKVVEIQVYEKTLKDSQYDRLTGLFNRQSLEDALVREIARAKRYSKSLSLLFLDLDNFKLVNDTYGHQTGDMALRHVSQIVRRECREEDTAARYGGEELVVIMPETDMQQALVLCERIRAKVETTPLHYEDETIRLTVSGGLATFPINAMDGAALLKCADLAVYQAKGAGKNNIATFSPDRRRYLRIGIEKLIQIKELGLQSLRSEEAKGKDISIGGILFEHTAPIAIGSKIELVMDLTDESPLFIIGTVVRVETFGAKRFEIGMEISFAEMDQVARTTITHFLAKAGRNN